uniref:tRNA (32-2'-O)-methyltransferase regulator THADA-like C-terminal TPR repeats region domain-containing protein n=3 Tax=Clastoptera arizonana TaxID=38151 RepID=A0A1B6CWA6_9HEMI
MKTRTLAASAMVPLISPDKLPQFVDKLISEIIHNDHSANTKHGILLQVSFLLEYCLELPEETILEMESKCEHWIEKLLKIWELPLCSVIVKTSVNVFDIMTARFSRLVCLDTWNSVLEKLKNILTQQNYCNIAYSLCLKKCAEVFIKINIMCKPSEEIICEVLNLLEHKEYEVFHTVLDFLLDLLSGGDKSKFYQSELLNYVKLTSAILENISLVDCLMNIMFLRNIHANDLEKLLSVVKIYPLFLREIHTNFGTKVFVDLCGSGDDTRIIDVLDCIGALLNEEILFTVEDIQTINNLLVEYSGSEWGEDNHKTIAQILLKHLKKLSSKDLPLNIRLKAYTSLVQLQYEEANMWQTLIQVLEDNEEDIQCKASVFLVLTLGDLTSCNPLDHVKGQVFDKGEVSIYYEEALLSRLAGRYFKNLLNSTDCQFLKIPLTSNLCEFLQKNCGIKCDSLDNFLCQISEKNVMEDYSKVCSFLRPGYQAAKLKSLRIKNVYM